MEILAAVVIIFVLGAAVMLFTKNDKVSNNIPGGGPSTEPNEIPRNDNQK